MTKFIIPFLLSFLLTTFFISVLIYLAGKIKWAIRKERRHIHKGKVYRVGGIGMALAFFLTVFFNADLVITPELYGLLIGSLVIMAVGFWDDYKEMHWKAQLFSQIAVAFFIFIMGVRIYYVTNPLNGGILQMDSGFLVIIATFLVIFWIILVTNAINWLDGIDGLSGGITLISSVTIFFLSLKAEVNQPPVAIIAAAFAGVIMSFLVFNFYPSRVLAGTSGAFFMGVVLSTLAVFSGTKIATALLVLAIPIMDLIWVIGERLKNKKSIFKADRKHLHYKLMELGWSQKKIVAYYYLATILVAIVALNTRVIGKSVTLLAAGIIMIGIWLFINKKTKGKID
ncbi:MAG TPA: MraY family glycosyltransferase [Candidatus Moranbacteria bacterium]|nr:MraY family glycosyltransferase [Candidatus Moranbacteria bacterium]